MLCVVEISRRKRARGVRGKIFIRLERTGTMVNLLLPESPLSGRVNHQVSGPLLYWWTQA